MGPALEAHVGSTLYNFLTREELLLYPLESLESL